MLCSAWMTVVTALAPAGDIPAAPQDDETTQEAPAALPPVTDEPPLPEAAPAPPVADAPDAVAPPAASPRTHGAPPTTRRAPRSTVVAAPERADAQRPDVGAFRSQPWAVMLASVSALWALAAPAPLFALLAASAITAVLAIRQPEVANALPRGEAVPLVLVGAVGGLGALALTGAAGWAVAVALAGLGLAVPPSMDISEAATHGSPVERLSAPTSVPWLEHFLAGRLPGADQSFAGLRVAAGSLVAMAGLTLLGAHFVAGTALMLAMTAAAVAGAVLAVVMVVALGKSGGKADLPEPPKASTSGAPGPRVHVYWWMPWWWLFVDPVPRPLVVIPGGRAADNREPAPAEDGSVKKWVGSMACAGMMLLPLDVGVRLFFRGLGAISGMDQRYAAHSEDTNP